MNICLTELPETDLKQCGALFKMFGSRIEAHVNTKTEVLFKSICPSEKKKKEKRNDLQLTVKGGFHINAGDSADRLCCNSSTSNHKYNEKKDRSDVRPRSHQSD